MVTPELLDYIRSESARGIEKDTIIQTLVGSGWLIQDVNDAFDALTEFPKSVPQSVSPATSPTASPSPSVGLEEKAANIEIAYDSAVEKVSELGGQQRQIVTDSVKELEQRKIDEIRQRLAKYE